VRYLAAKAIQGHNKPNPNFGQVKPPAWYRAHHLFVGPGGSPPTTTPKR
jgi:hypothetical protein